MSNTKKRPFKQLYLQILFVLFTFALIIVSTYFFTQNMEKRHLEEQIDITFTNIEYLLYADLKEFETLTGTVSETIRGMMEIGFDLDTIKRYMVDMTNYEKSKNQSTGFFGFFAGFGEDGMDGFNSLVPDLDIAALIARGYNPKERPWYIAAETSGNEIVITEPYIDEVEGSKEVTFTYVKNIFDNDGKRLGIICLDVLLDRIYKFSMENRKDDISFWVLHDKNHVVLAHPNPEFIGIPFREVPSGFTVLADMLEKGGSVSNYLARDYQGKQAFFSMKPLDNGWHLGIITHTDTYYSNLQFILWFLISLGVLLAGVLIMILIRINAARDKSEKLALKAVEEKKELGYLNNILNGVNATICVTDPVTDEIIFVNESMKRDFNVPDDYEGQKCFKVLRKFNAKCDFCPCPKLALDPDKEIIWERYNELTKRIYRSYSKFIKWPDGRNVHIQHAVDITDLKKAEREIVEKNMQLANALGNAENANKAKSAFLANMSHEIRTPMNAILGITEIQLRDETLSPEMEEGLGRVYDSGHLLLNIINDILDLSKIEAGRLELTPVKYDIPSLINDTVQLNLLRYEGKPLEFSLDVDENTPLNLFGDELRIKQVLNNILSNAFKYTDKGEVRMSVSHEEDKSDNITLIFRVADTGQGMTPEQIDHLFDEYTRFNLEINRTTVGTGLGMSITKRLLDLMNGKIYVESEAGKGSVFTVKLPQKRIDSLVCGKEMSERLRNFSFQNTAISKKARMLREYMPYGKVLVVDDVETNIYVTRGMLLPYGLKIDTAQSGFDAIEKVKAGNVYDIIFMDHMMPKMDGIEATRLIREWEKSMSNEQLAISNEKSKVSNQSDMSTSQDNKQQNCSLLTAHCSLNHVTIIALTANALVGQAEVFLKNGFDGYISKPIDSRELNQILNEFIRNRKPPEVVKAARREQREKNKRIYGEGNLHIRDGALFEHNEDPGKKHEGEVIMTEVQKFFIMDAESTIAILEEMLGKIEEKDLDSYEIAVHGIKSALANIGEADLSAAALRLEKAAMDKNLELITKETPVLIDALKELLKKLNFDEETAPSGSTAYGIPQLKEENMLNNEDTAFLNEKLKKIITACGEFNIESAKAALDEINLKKWPRVIDDLLDEINVHLLNSALRKAKDIAGKCLAVIGF